MARKIQSAYELCEASGHVLYEIGMLFGTLHNLEIQHFRGFPGSEPLKTHNAHIESWTIHVRNLQEFLRSVKGRDYILAEHYFDHDAEWHTLLHRRRRNEIEKRIDRRVAKEIVHLTYQRLRVTEAEKMWEMREISHGLAVDLRVFIDNVRADRVQRDFHKEAIRACEPVLTTPRTSPVQA